MLMTVKRKSPMGYAIMVKGRCLAPMIHCIENVDEIEQFMSMANVPCENWSLDERRGQVIIEGFGSIPIGEYVVYDEYGLHHYDELENLRADYEMVY